MYDVQQQPPCFKSENERGFTLIEVLISIAITVVVMASVFALLTRGQRSFQREPEIADLQQNARNVLDMVSRDILQAGAGLPPEFPAFTQNGGDGAPADSIEIIGVLQRPGQTFLVPEEVGNIVVGGACPSVCAEVVSMRTNFEPGDVLVLYNDVPNENPIGSQWAMVEVVSVDESQPLALIELDFATHAAYSFHGSPPAVEGNAAAVDPVSFGGFPKLTSVSVVRYDTLLDDPASYAGPPPRLVRRSVDGAIPQPVGYLEDFQIVYFIGVTAPAQQNFPPVPITDIGPLFPLTAENMLSSVRVTVTARSISANLEGASEGADATSIADNFIRKTFSTNVNPRNLSAALEIRAVAVAP